MFETISSNNHASVEKLGGGFKHLYLIGEDEPQFDQYLFQWERTTNQRKVFALFLLIGILWSNYSDLTRPHPKWWFSKGNPLISGKPRLVKYNTLASNSPRLIGGTPTKFTTDDFLEEFPRFQPGRNSSVRWQECLDCGRRTLKRIM